MPPELQKLLDELDAADRDAKAVADGLSEQQGTWRPSPGAWSVAECLDHLAVSNRVYLAPIVAAASEGRAHGRMRRGPAFPASSADGSRTTWNHRSGSRQRIRPSRHLARHRHWLIP
jgi:hypothetical protein